eukprot:5149374-Amphidinium_carterae.2
MRYGWQQERHRPHGVVAHLKKCLQGQLSIGCGWMPSPNTLVSTTAEAYRICSSVMAVSPLVGLASQKSTKIVRMHSNSLG